MIEFTKFLLSKLYKWQPVPDICIEKAFENVVLDVQYHFPNLTKKDVEERILTNQNELPIFLFRLGRQLHIEKLDHLKWQIHWLLRELCACEIYFNNIIEVGFYIVHGLGAVIGSRNEIGKGFKIHQGCTIGHKKNGAGAGSSIKNNVVMYANSSVIGALEVGNNVVIGANVLVTEDVQDNRILTLNKKTKSKVFNK